MATHQIHINDLEAKLEAVIRTTKDEEVIAQCESWYETIHIMRTLGLRFITLEDYGDDEGLWNIH